MNASPGGIGVARRLFWCVRRELWEHRSLALAPMAVAVLILVGFAISLGSLPAQVRAAAAAGAPDLRRVVERPYLAAALVLMAVEMLVAALYAVDALYGERRDRSIRFWKSLPVSDGLTVVAKASIPVLLLPLFTAILTTATQLAMSAVSSIVLGASGLDAAIPWTQIPLFEIWRVNLVHLVAFHGLWWAPLYAWLLLASAWATRVPILWAVLPPVAIGIVERVAFGTSVFANAMTVRFLGAPTSGPEVKGMSMDMLGSHTLVDFLTHPGFWVGLAVAAMFLAGAARLRRLRAPI